MENATLDYFFAAFRHLRSSSYTTAAGSTIHFYDILLTLEDERRLIWPSRLSLVKVLYLINRYFPIPCLLVGMYHLAALRPAVSLEFCQFTILSQLIGQALGLIAATWLLVIRVVALYGGNKIVAVILYSTFLVTHTISIAVGLTLIGKGWSSIAYIEPVHLCSLTVDRLLGAVYFAPVVCEIMLVSLQVYHAYRHSHRGLDMRRSTPLLRTLYGDGFVYFAVVVALRLWNAFLFVFADISFWYMATYLEFSLVSVSVSRLVLHLRGAAQGEEEEEEDDYFLSTASNMPGRRRPRDREAQPTDGADTLVKSVMSNQTHPQVTFGMLDRPQREQSTYASGLPMTQEENKSKSNCSFYYPFHSRGSSGGKGLGAMLNIPSTSGSWTTKRTSRHSSKPKHADDDESEKYVSGGDGDSYMELSPVTASKGRDIRSLELDEERGDNRDSALEPLTTTLTTKGEDSSPRSELDIHGTGIG